MNVYNAVTKVTLAEKEDRIILTHVFDKKESAKQPVTVVLSLAVDAAGELAHQITTAIQALNKRRFEQGNFPEKTFHIPSGRSHA